MQYHAHIYWENDTEKKEALSLRLTLLFFRCHFPNIYGHDIAYLNLNRFVFDKSKKLIQ